MLRVFYGENNVSSENPQTLAPNSNERLMIKFSPWDNKVVEKHAQEMQNLFYDVFLSPRQHLFFSNHEKYLILKNILENVALPLCHSNKKNYNNKGRLANTIMIESVVSISMIRHCKWWSNTAPLLFIWQRQPLLPDYISLRLLLMVIRLVPKDKNSQ